MTREDMIKEVHPEVKRLADHAQVVSQAAELLKRSLNGDVNFTSLEECHKLLEESLSVDMKDLVRKIRKAMGSRAKARLKELGAF